MHELMNRKVNMVLSNIFLPAKTNIGFSFRNSILVTIIIYNLLISTALAQSGLHASVDRNTIRMGETVRLTIEAMEQINGNDIDLSGVERDFNVLGRSSSSSINIVNGVQAIRMQLLFELEPLREGSATIPAISIGKQSTKPVTLTILPEDIVAGQSSAFVVEVIANPEQTWVEAPITLSIKLFINDSVNLLEGSLDEPRIEGAQLQRLGEDVRYTATKKSNRYSVVERRYVMHTSRSGTLAIPEVRFTGEIADTSRSSLNSFFRQGRRVNARSEAFNVTIKSPPDSYTGKKWLPASELQLSEVWENDAQQLEVGVPTTWTLKIAARGLRGQQLPEFDISFPESISAYPDKPKIESGLDQSQLIGVLEQKIALVPLQAGTLNIPSVEVSWWDIEENIEKKVQLPARTVTVVENQAVARQGSSTDGASATLIANENAKNLLYWQYATIILSVLWLVTLAILIRIYNRQNSKYAKLTNTDTSVSASAVSRSEIKKALLANKPNAARSAIIGWCMSMNPSKTVTSLI